MKTRRRYQDYFEENIKKFLSIFPFSKSAQWEKVGTQKFNRTEPSPTHKTILISFKIGEQQQWNASCIAMHCRVYLFLVFFNFSGRFSKRSPTVWSFNETRSDKLWLFFWKEKSWSWSSFFPLQPPGPLLNQPPTIYVLPTCQDKSGRMAKQKLFNLYTKEVRRRQKCPAWPKLKTC